jgi:hypothetical protein
MLNIVIDIETIPDQREGALDSYLTSAKEEFRAPSTLTKEQAAKDLGLTNKDEIKFTGKDEMVARWVEHFREAKAPEQAEQKWRKTALNGSSGELAVIGYAIDGGCVTSFQRPDLSVAGEQELLGNFFDAIGKDILAENGSKFDICLIGHNLESFDLRFLFQRAVIRRVRPSINLNVARYSDKLYDTMTAWAGFQGHISLDALCKALGVPSPKDGLDGSMVWDYVRDGRIDEVAQYCRADVAATRQVFQRMTFTEASA